MTFEEFKKHYLGSSKIDTPEILAICESQFKRHLLSIDDQNYFEPFEFRSGDDMSSRYEQNLRAILPFDNIQENQLSFLIKPSFDPESLLMIEKHLDNYILSYTTLTTNYWYVFYADNKMTDIEKRVSKAELRADIGDKLFSLLDNAIIEARQPKAGMAVLDGTAFQLSRMLNGKKICVFKHSPGQGSKTANIIDILLYLTDNIKSLDNATIATIEKQIDALIL